MPFYKKRGVDTGSVDNEKQESVDNSPGHLKIGKDFTMGVRVLHAKCIVKSLPIFRWPGKSSRVSRFSSSTDPVSTSFSEPEKYEKTYLYKI